MALNELVRTSQLKMNQLEQIAGSENANQHFYVNYDDSDDTLIVLFADPFLPTIVHPIDHDVALLYDPQNLNVVGIQVERFQQKFVRENGSVAKVWQTTIHCDGEVDLGLIFQIAEIKKPQIAHEVARVAKDIVLGRSHNKPNIPLPA